MSTISSFKSIENEHDVYRGKYCMKTFCQSLEHAMEIINFEKNKMKLLANEQQKSYENAKICYICREKFEDKNAKDKKYCKVRDHCHYTGEYRGVAHRICNVKCSVPKEIAIVFHIGSSYDCHFIIKEIAEEFEGQCNILGKNNEKYITISFPIEKEVTRIDNKGKNC